MLRGKTIGRARGQQGSFRGTEGGVDHLFEITDAA
jgi:hypothetical protein